MRTSRPALQLAFLAFLAASAAAAPSPAPSTALPAEGTASWYGLPFHGRKTASGEIFDRFAFTAAHRSLPFGSLLLVTNLGNGARVVVRINDRGPFVKGRLIDLSEAAAAELGMIASGTARVLIEPAGGLPPGPARATAVQAGRAGLASGASPAVPEPSPEPAGGNPGAGRYCDVRVASFSNPANAERALERLRAAGYGPVAERGGGYLRIYIRGLPASRAEETRARLAELGFPGVMLSFYERAD